MKKAQSIFVLTLTFFTASLLIMTHRQAVVLGAAEGYVIERDAEVAKNEPGPHAGSGQSTGYIFFESVPNLKFSFRKRVLHSGASIGYHLQQTDEVYYVLSGT